MKRYMKAILAVSILPWLMLSDDGSGNPGRAARPGFPSPKRVKTFLSAPDNPERIQFHIATIEESGDERNVVSEATIEGPEGTDFNINLQGERFRMRAGFLTDLAGPDVLKIRARLDTRRLYGYSERRLPLYEEDEQSQNLQLGFDEAIVLLPFGRDGGDDRLKIEITPSVSEQAAHLPSGKARPLEIKILKESPGGAISIEASKIPHHFAVEATLVEDGREVAEGKANYLLEEGQEMQLRPTGEASEEILKHPLAINLTIDNYTRSRPADQVALSFDISELDRQQGSPMPTVIASKWAGIGSLGSELTYDLSQSYLKATGKKYELRFKVSLADGELSD